MKKAIRILAVAIALFMLSTTLLAACEPDEPTNNVTVTISRVEINIEVGASETLTATASDGSAVTWSTSDASVATVENGVVTGVKKGTATITATAGEAKATCAVTVREKGEVVTKLPKTYVDDGKNYTYNTYASQTPSTWNELDSVDSADDAIMGYIGSAFFEYDYKFEGGKYNADGTLNVDGLVADDFVVNYSAATALQDVTAQYGEQWGLTAAQISEGKYIWKITLRNDLAWDDGTPIFAEDFVYSMQQQLSPDFLFERADSYYNNAVKIHNAKNYVYQGRGTSIESFNDLGLSFSFVVDGKYDGDGSYKGLTVYIDVENSWGLDVADAVTPIEGAIGNWVPITDDTLIRDPAVPEGTDEDYVSAKYLHDNYFGPSGPYSSDGLDVVGTISGQYPDELSFDEVGIFSEGNYDIILVLDNPISFFKEDGSLSYRAAYDFASLPLVKMDLFETTKQAPQLGSTQWTSNYNNSLETSASWGPYKLTFFQADKEWRLERNEYWYGYGAENFLQSGEYLTDKIVYQYIKQSAAAQLAFWSGQVDSLGIDVTIADDYKNSTYAIYSPSIATYGVQVFSDLDTLNQNKRNNSILAITEFRKALSLSLNRDSYNQETSTANQTCLGMMGEDYYYDIENNLTYRGSEAGKKAILRAYGWTQTADGKWTDGTQTMDTVDEAYDVTTGYNLPLAKQFLQQAITELTTNATKYNYDASKNITLLFGTTADNESSQRTLRFIQNWINTLVEGSALEGKIEVKLDASAGNGWAAAFQQGLVDLSTSGFGNAPFDPYYMIGGNINIGLSLHPYWDTSKEFVEFTLPEVDGVDYDREGETLRLSVVDWYNSLNGNMSANPTANWSDGNCPTEARLEILAMLEEYALTNYKAIMTSRGYGASLRAAKWHFISDEYNVMLGYGGLQYRQFDYTDEEWTAFVQQQGGDLRDFYKN